MESLCWFSPNWNKDHQERGSAHRLPKPHGQDPRLGQVNEYMYMDDRMKSGKTSMLRSDLLHELVFTPVSGPQCRLTWWSVSC